MFEIFRELAQHGWNYRSCDVLRVPKFRSGTFLKHFVCFLNYYMALPFKKGNFRHPKTLARMLLK